MFVIDPISQQGRWTRGELSNRKLDMCLFQIDIFREKLPVSRLSRFFPDYRGDDLDYEAACSFLLDKFASLNQNIEKSIYAVSCTLRLIRDSRLNSSFPARRCVLALHLCHRHKSLKFRSQRRK